MPLFAIIGHDVANSAEQRKITRPEHVTRLKALEDEGRLVIAGPTPIKHGEEAISGSIVIAEFATLEAVQAWANDEPYLRDGVYSHVDIKPFIQAIPAP